MDHIRENTQHVFTAANAARTIRAAAAVLPGVTAALNHPNLPAHLRVVAQLRADFPHASTTELADKAHLSTHQFRYRLSQALKVTGARGEA